ncbi:Uncharacterised protein r2_g181 [Pycnogonum litorale]
MDKISEDLRSRPRRITMRHVRTLFSSVTVEPTVLFFSICTFMAYPCKQKFIFTNACYQQGYSWDYCLENSSAKCNDEIQRNSSYWLLYSNILLTVSSSIMVLYAGAWGDMFGRKIPLLIPPFGSIAANIILAVDSYYLKTAPLWLILVASTVNGLCGSEVTTIASAISYVTSVSCSEHRIFRLGMVEASIILGGTIGPSLSGLIYSAYGTSTVFFTAAGAAMLSLLCTIFLVKNTEVASTDVRLKNICNLQHIKNALYICFRPRPRSNKRKYILLCILTIGIHFLTIAVDVSLNFLFLEDKPLFWGYETYTLWHSLTSGLRGIGLLCVLPTLRYGFGLRDTTIGIFGGISGSASLLLFGLGVNSVMIFLSSIVGFITVLEVVAARSIISKNVESDEEGKIFAVSGTLQNTILLIFGVIFNELWPITRHIHKGILHEISSALIMVTIGIMFYLRTKIQNETSVSLYHALEQENTEQDLRVG